MIKKLVLGIFVLAMNVVLANPPVDTFAKEDYPDEWAFNVDEIAIWCMSGKQLYVVDYTDDQWYALNGPGKVNAKTNNAHADITPIWADNEKTGAKKSLSPWINKGLDLCK